MMLTLDLPKPLEDALKREARHRHQSAKSVAEEALLRYLEDQDDIRVCEERIKKGGKTITLEELKKELAL